MASACEVGGTISKGVLLSIGAVPSAATGTDARIKPERVRNDKTVFLDIDCSFNFVQFVQDN